MSVTETLVRFALERRYEDIPPSVRQHARERILDTFAVMVGGSVERCTQIAAEYVRVGGGAPVAGVVAQDFRTTPQEAAFVNGVAAHALDYDDTSSATIGHISVCNLPAILAVAEMAGASGKDVLAAYILSYEVEARIGLGVEPHHILKGWHPVPTLGSFGAAIGAARVLGLDQQRARWAMGIAGSETGGIRKNIGTMTKPFHAGHGARNGVVAALLASRGYTANPDILDGVPGIGHDHFGFCETFNGPGTYSMERMVEGLGTVWELDEPRTFTKCHPGATGPAVPIDLTLRLVKEHNIRPEQVEKVQVGTTSLNMAIGCYPRPKNGLDARYSLWYDVAVSIVDRKAGLHQYTDERVPKPDVQAMLAKVDCFIDPECEEGIKGSGGHYGMGGIAKVTIHLKDGRVVSGKATSARGYPDNRCSWDDIADKFRECADYANLASKGVDVGGFIAMVKDLEKLPDAGVLLKILCPA